MSMPTKTFVALAPPCWPRSAIAALLALTMTLFVAPAAWADQCGPGQVHDTVEKTNEKGIVVGTYDICVPCKGGTIANQSHTQCVACSLGSSANVTHTSCVPCSKGTVGVLSNGTPVCKLCGAGAISDTEGATSCHSCVHRPHLGYITNAAHTACIACDAGTYTDDHVTCKKCPAGTFSHKGSNCRSCPSGTVSNADRTNCTCSSPTAYISSGTCVACPPKQVANASHTSCAPCPAGKHFEYGGCVPNPQAVPSHPTFVPNILDNNNPGLGPQGPAATGRPSGGGGAPSRGPAGIR